MALRQLLGVCAIVVTTAAGAGAVPARRPPTPLKLVLAAVDRQAERGHLNPADATRYRAVARRTARLASLLPESRAAPLHSQLAQAAAVASKLTAPRALAVFGQLAANDDWFARHGPPAAQTDITDADGVLYRYFPGLGFEFHPLGDFGALNNVAAGKDIAATARLARALAARGVPEPGGGEGWEYYFDYSGGGAPWLSGFAQAVAAQAFARAATVDTADAPALDAAARAAYRAIPGRLDRQTSFGPWIKLYSFDRAVVLNAQLQSAISLAYYAEATSDGSAGTLAARLTTAAARALPAFTTGFWSYYQLPSDPSPVHYQDYVVQLLQALAKRDDRFASAAEQFAGFSTVPPRFKLADAGVGAVTFWVSKPSTVRIAALGGVRGLSVAGGWHTVTWALPRRAGIFPITIHATDWAGNSASVDALPIVHVAAPPAPHRKARRKLMLSAAAQSEPPLLVGAGLDQPEQASLATAQGLQAVRMTLVWPAGASSPDPGAVTALGRLPSGANLVLELFASPLPSDDAGRSALAAYAASVASQVPTLRDLIVGPAPSVSTAPAYEAALGAVYDAVKAAAPGVRVDGALDGSVTPKASLTALAAAYRTAGRPAPLMDELAFTPAPGAGKNLWPLSSLPTLISTLGSGFAGTDQPGASLALIVDDVSAPSAIPTAELPLYSSPTVGTTGLEETAQAAYYASSLQAVACRPTVVALLLTRLVDGRDPGAQSGLFYPDGTPKTSLAAFAQAISTAQSTGRGCTPASPTPIPTPTPMPTPNPAPPPTTTPSPPVKPQPPTTPAPAVVLDTGQLAFPAHLSTSSTPSVHLGCSAACLYLVTLQRANDGTPVLAARGSIPKAGARTVKLPKRTIASGRYRFSVWTVAAANPGPVSVDRSPVVSAG